MTTFSKLNLPATYQLSTPVSMSFQIEKSTFGILTVPLRQLDIQLDLTEATKPERSPSDSRESSLSSEASMLLRAGMADVQAGHVAPVSPELYQTPGE